MKKEPTLFVWRGNADSRDHDIILWENYQQCFFCYSKIEPISKYNKTDGTNWGSFTDEAICVEATCPKCGWSQGNWKSWHPGTSISSEIWVTQKVLKEFSISSDQVALEELGTYLKSNFKDIYLLDPIRFEELVAAIFKEHGWQVELTQHSRDGGKDIIMCHSITGEKALVECKRYRNKISVEKVDRLIGVQLIEGIQKAFFVTSSDYTMPAKQRQFSPNMNNFGFSIELKNANDLLKLLDCFNELIPPKNRCLETLA